MLYKIICLYETLNIPRNGELVGCRIWDVRFRHLPKTNIKRKVPITHNGDKHFLAWLLEDLQQRGINNQIC